MEKASLDVGLEGQVFSRRDFLAVASAATTMIGGSRAAALGAESHGEQPLTLRVNGTEHNLDLDPRVTLLDALRDRLRLTGTKKGCDQGTCGACTVLVNGRRIVSCLTLAVMHDGDAVTTIEGVATGDTLHPVQRAFIRADGFQCGYCTPGQIVSAIGMINEGHTLDRETIQMQMSGNLCRCGCYAHITDAVLAATQNA